MKANPGLQFIGDRLDEIQIALVFHQHYCVPDTELTRLRRRLKAHQALALVFGSGIYRGWFVITDITAVSEQTDSTGNVLAMNATVSLREYTGDLKSAETARHTHSGTGVSTSGAVPKPSGIASACPGRGELYPAGAVRTPQTTVSAVRIAQK